MTTAADASDQPLRRGWTAWSASWLATLAASLVAVITLASLSSEAAEEALERALADQLTASAAMASAALADAPLELLAELGGARSSEQLGDQLQALQGGGSLRNLALIGPGGSPVFASSEDHTWLVAQAEADLISRAASGQRVAGPLYRDASGELYLSAYAPVPGHEGWIVAVEGSGANLRAVDALRSLQAVAGLAVLVLAGALGAVLARFLSQPLWRLDRELSECAPGDPVDRLTVQGPREVRGVARAARELLAAIRSRDDEIEAAHTRELEQVTRMAAEVAHEVRNPLNAISLTVDRLARIDEPERREPLVRRVQDQIGQLDSIVHRFVDLANPPDPQLAQFDLSEVARAVAREHEGADTEVVVRGASSAPIESDRVMVAEVLRNLCLNACQAGAAYVELRIDRADNSVTIDVVDDGDGIGEDQVAHLFDWFHTTRAGGSGLGLPVSRRIVTSLGGRIELLERDPARFRISLPAVSP